MSIVCEQGLKRSVFVSLEYFRSEKRKKKSPPVRCDYHNGTRGKWGILRMAKRFGARLGGADCVFLRCAHSVASRSTLTRCGARLGRTDCNVFRVSSP